MSVHVRRRRSTRVDVRRARHRTLTDTWRAQCEWAYSHTHITFTSAGQFAMNVINSLACLLATVHTNVDKSLCLTLTCKDLSFHKEPIGISLLLLLLPVCLDLLTAVSPFSVIIEPRYLNVSTCSSSLPWHIIAICSFRLNATNTLYQSLQSSTAARCSLHLSRHVCHGGWQSSSWVWLESLILQVQAATTPSERLTDWQWQASRHWQQQPPK